MTISRGEHRSDEQRCPCHNRLSCRRVTLYSEAHFSSSSTGPAVAGCLSTRGTPAMSQCSELENIDVVSKNMTGLGLNESIATACCP